MTRKKRSRKKVLSDVETAVLAHSARRCTLCFHLKGDLTEKMGQIAHLDRDPSNRSKNNLAWMCLEHHTIYDSKASQHKNYTNREVKAARAKLYALVADGQHLTAAAALPYRQDEADKNTLREFLKTVPSNGSIRYLRDFFGGSYLREDRIEDIERFLHERSGPDHEFLDSELESARQRFRNSCLAFDSAVGTETQPTNTLGCFAIPSDWEFDNPKRYHQALRAMNKTAQSVCRTYDKLVRLARKKLAI
jgi:hypothetical protein